MIDTYDFCANINKKDKEAFNDALPVGNGSLGAMIYGGADKEKLVLNEETLWLGNPKRNRVSKDAYEGYQLAQEALKNDDYEECEKIIKKYLFSRVSTPAIYTTAGELDFEFHNQSKQVLRKIDYEHGLVTVETEEQKRTYFASYPNDVIVMNIASPKKSNFDFSLKRDKQVDFIGEKDHYLVLKYNYQNNMNFNIVIDVLTDGHAEIINGCYSITNATNTTIYLAMSTSYRHSLPFHYCKKSIKEAKALSYQSLLEKHVNDFSNQFHKTEVELSNYNLNRAYQLAKYLMISSSRKNTLPSNLQGLWNQVIYPSWDSKYTININTQMNYWPALSFGLLDSCYSVFNLLKKMVKRGRMVARTMYHARGFVCHHNTDLYGDCAIVDEYMPASMWPFGGAWLSLLIYEAYEYTLDIQILKEYGYILNEASLFFIDTLILDSNGYYRFMPSLSPENSFLYKNKKTHICKGATLDSLILYDLFNATIKTNDLLHQNKKINEQLKEMISKLPKLRKSQYNTIAEWEEDYEELEPGHRHISQCYALYPSNRINTEELKELAYNTIKRRLDNGGGHTGWSMAWILCMLARLNESELFSKYLNQYFEHSVSRVGLDLHPPFQIDGNFGLAAAINEAMVQYKDDTIILLPIKLNDLNGKVHNLHLKNNLLLDLDFSNGIVNSFKLYTKNSMTINVLVNDQQMKCELMPNKVFEWN